MELNKRRVLSGSRFLSFSLNEENYCLDILKVKEMVGLSKITAIPQTPEYIKGVINLRGRIIPIIDLRIKFGMPEKEYDKRTSIIVIELHEEGETIYMGIVVDTIQEVLGIPEEKITKLPYINSKIKSEYIRGIAETPEGIKIVLDIEKVLNSDEFVLLKELPSFKTAYE